MTDFRQRVIDEKHELDVRIEALQAFIYSHPTFQRLPIAEQWRMTTQSHLMTEYSAILGARIAAFEVKE